MAPRNSHREAGVLAYWSMSRSCFAYKTHTFVICTDGTFHFIVLAATGKYERAIPRTFRDEYFAPGWNVMHPYALTALMAATSRVIFRKYLFGIFITRVPLLSPSFPTPQTTIKNCRNCRMLSSTGKSTMFFCSKHQFTYPFSSPRL